VSQFGQVAPLSSDSFALIRPAPWINQTQAFLFVQARVNFSSLASLVLALLVLGILITA
jgi:hypothetical protein